MNKYVYVLCLDDSPSLFFQTRESAEQAVKKFEEVQEELKAFRIKTGLEDIYNAQEEMIDMVHNVLRAERSLTDITSQIQEAEDVFDEALNAWEEEHERDFQRIMNDCLVCDHLTDIIYNENDEQGYRSRFYEGSFEYPSIKVYRDWETTIS